MARRNDKRSRLIAAADKLFHSQGVNITTLANIAQLAEVPLGNVYYYFKSKDSIVHAVIEYRNKILQDQLFELNNINDSRQRIIALIQQIVANKEEITTSGDAIGSLCQELGCQGGELASAAAKLMNTLLSWLQEQFSALGKNNSQDLATNLFSTIQGMQLIALTFKESSYLDRQSNYLIDWINQL